MFSFWKEEFRMKKEFGKQKQEKLCKIWEINDDENELYFDETKKA